MKRVLFVFCFTFISLSVFAQKDSLNIGDKYLEDQLYILATYNVLRDQPSNVKNSGFSYGFSGGFIRDIPLNKNKTLGLGIGVGYGFDSFNHGLKVTENNNQVTFEVDNSLTSNKLRLHNLEIPIEFRWRNSTAKRYDFWRIYTGVKITYNLSNRFEYNLNDETFVFTNVSRYNNWQTGFIFSAGYAAFNFHFYYGFSPILKNSSIGTNNISTKVMKFGLTFYVL